MTGTILSAALCLILLPTSLTAQTAPQPANTDKAAVLGWLGSLSQKMRSCQQAGEAAGAKMDKLDLKKSADASAIRAAFIPVRDVCLAAQRDMQAMPPPASLAGDKMAEAGRLLQSCTAVVGNMSELSDGVIKVAGAFDSSSDARNVYMVLAQRAIMESINCDTTIRKIEQQSGANDAMIAVLIVPFSF